jgi:hypothetical protein
MRFVVQFSYEIFFCNSMFSVAQFSCMISLVDFTLFNRYEVSV